MKILIFSWRDPKHPMAGGAEQVMHEHAKGWIKAGHSVTLFSSYFIGGKREENIEGVRVIRRGVQLIGVQALGAFWYLFEKHEKFDVVIDQFHGIPFFTPLYAFTKKLAVIQEVAKEVWLMNHLPKPFNWIVGYIGYALEPLIFLFYKGVPFMTGSDSAKKDLVNFGIPERNITVVPHGVIVPRPDVGVEKPKTKTVTFLGALTKDKGIEEAIKAFSILNKSGDYHFWIVGKGAKTYIEELKNLSRALEVQNKIKFWGFVNEAKKFELLTRAHLLVNPSVREGWGLVNIEANAMGTPVISYNSPGLTDSVKDGRSGVILKTNSPSELARKVGEVLERPAYYKSLQEGAISWSKNFSWSNSRRISQKLIMNL